MKTLLHNLGRRAYAPTLALQDELRGRVAADPGEPGHLVLVEHDPAVITLGRRTRKGHVLAGEAQLRKLGIEVHASARGGSATWHGPGQLVAYPILRLSRTHTVRAHIHGLEEALLATLARFGVRAHRAAGLTGVWVGDEKVAAIGVAVSHWVAWHGLALNVDPDLDAFRLIVPCGVEGRGVTSLARLLGRKVDLEEVKPVLLECLAAALGLEVPPQEKEPVGAAASGDQHHGNARDEHGPQIAAGSGSCTQHQVSWSRDALVADGRDEGVPTPGNSTSPATPSTTPPGSGQVDNFPRAARGQKSAIPRPRLPAWLRRPIPPAGDSAEVRQILAELKLPTVCTEALCPNIHDCFSRRTATFMILGDLCTRACRFCGVERGRPAPPREDEPEALAEACARLGLRHVVITAVTRDDLPDGGAAHFARTIRAVRARLPSARIEVLTSDFRGSTEAVDTVLAARPAVFSHNLETVARLQRSIRGQANYAHSLTVLSHAAQQAARLNGVGQTAATERRPPTRVFSGGRRSLAAIPEPRPLSMETHELSAGQTPDRHRLAVKSGLMLGLGETFEEVLQAMRDLRGAGCTMLTVGQYLPPSAKHAPALRFAEPAEFEALEREARGMGFLAVAAGPYVRSSYLAEEKYAQRISHTATPSDG